MRRINSKFFPNLNDDQREFLMTGITEEEWDEINESLEMDERMSISYDTENDVAF